MLICRHRRKEVVQSTVTKQAYQSSQADVLQQPSQSSSNLDVMTIEYEYIMYGRDQKVANWFAAIFKHPWLVNCSQGS